jgi:hypothetical protein
MRVFCATRATAKLLATVLLLSACGMKDAARQDAEPQFSLEVHNRSLFDVNVFALPSVGTTHRVRLGFVSGFSTTRLVLPMSGLAINGTLTVMVDAIGSRSAWISSSVVISDDLQPCLEVLSDLHGDLSRSVLYTVIVDPADTSSVTRFACPGAP